MWEQHNFSGRLVSFDGLDGSGKSTQVERLHQWIKEHGQTVTVLKQPSDDYRRLPEVRRFLEGGGSATNAEVIAKLSARDRMEQQRTDILPELERGQWVLLDRSLISGLALFERRGVGAKKFISFHSNLVRPDVCFFIDVSAEVAFSRVHKRGLKENKFEERSVDDFARTRDCFLKFSHEMTVIDGEDTPKGVFRRLISELAI